MADERRVLKLDINVKVVDRKQDIGKVGKGLYIQTRVTDQRFRSFRSCKK